jgi:phospholipid/cholesterol/gamma-HCH transport system substrate-binding protein
VIKQAPSVGRILTMVLFSLSCIGLLLYLWLTFGGSIPLKPEGYRMHVKFPEATSLAQEADVRISGVNVGKVKTKEPDNDTGLTDVEIEIDSKYAPMASNTRAILRQKTLLGETYVELAPGGPSDTTGSARSGSADSGDPNGATLPDGGTLPQGQVGTTVELDEIFRAFDEKTRRAFSSWLDQQGRAVDDRGESLNDALGVLEPFADDTEDVLRILRRQDAATRQLVRDTGAVFEALTERQGQLRELVVNSNRVFETTASRDRALADTFTVFPTFLRETRATVTRTTEFAENTNPLITQLRPAARELSPTLIQLSALAPDLRGLFKDLDPLIKVSRRGLPALETFLDETKPLLARSDSFLRQVNPILDYLGLYKREIAAFFANDVASTQATDLPPGRTRPLHYLRTTNPLNAENLAAYPTRLPTNRSNPYTEPGGYDQLPQGLPVFGEYLCTSGPLPQLGPGVGEPLFSLLNQFVFDVINAPGPVAPPCREQPPLGRLVGQAGKYPRLQPDP